MQLIRIPRILILGALLVTPVAPRLRAQGTLAPPPGPPAPTMKALDQIEPRVAVESLAGVTSDCLHLIDKPGSYYLTGNLIGAKGLNGIHVTTDSVTIDLNGFRLIGVPGSQYGVLSVQQMTTVHNGVVRDWGTGGVAVLGSNSVVESISVCNNSGIGIYGSSNVAIRHCQSIQNMGTGVIGFGGSLIESCVVSGNGGGGINLTGTGGRVAGCAITGNTGRGIDLLNGGDWFIEGNAVNGNSLNGIRAQARCHIVNNAINSNGNLSSGSDGAGILLTAGSDYVQGNHLFGNRYGIYADLSANDTVIGNVAIGSTTANYFGNGGGNAFSFGPIVTTAATMTTPADNLSLP